MRTNTHLALHGKSERRVQKSLKSPPVDSSDCYYCGEPLALLGVLGSRVHLRCVGCGMECSTVDPDALEAATEALDEPDLSLTVDIDQLREAQNDPKVQATLDAARTAFANSRRI